jgi:feruloyl esterase
VKQFILLFLTSICLYSSNVYAGSFFQKEKDPCIPCEELQKLQLPDVTILKATTIIPEKKDGKMPSPAKPHCQVLGRIGKELNFEVLLPEKWNERFLMGGNGGFAGELIYSMRETMDSGYVIAGSDVGHKGGLTASWALNNMQRQLDFGHLGIHRTQAVAKEIINHYYCSYPLYSYFMGVSRGGGQAMMEAQRYPEDFDGTVAGFPAFNWVPFSGKFVQNAQKIYPDPAHKVPVITKENLQLLQKLIMQKCDMLDGVRDTILNDPRECKFNVNEVPVCPDDKAGPDCFTKAQALAIKTVYSELKNEYGQIHPGFPLGGEDERNGWDNWIVGVAGSPLSEPSLQAFFGIESLKYLVFNDSTWDYSKYDFSNFSKDTRYASAYLDATNTDYSSFKNRKGKMILFQGFADPVISALGIIRHYETAEKADPQIRDYMRLFMLPGVLHGGGRGPDQANWVRAIRDWVENGVAPQRIILSKLPQPGMPALARPTFPYPHEAVYNGKGDPNKENSFTESK